MTRILIAEDDPDLALGLKNNLEIEGYEVQIACDGDAALTRARQWRPELLILDLVMPKLDGLRVLRDLRAHDSSTAVLILTARGDEADKVRGLKLGADDYVTKPFGLLELLARVESLLRRRRGTLPDGAADQVLRFGTVEVDQAARRVLRSGSEVVLRPTLIDGQGPLVVGSGPVRTGVTVIVPHDGDPWAEPLFAGTATLNGNGEVTGLEWIRESGLLTGPIGLTNTNDVGKVRDALVSSAAASRDPGAVYWVLPVAGETYDGQLHDIAGRHVQAEHVAAALGAASGGAVAEGNVGGGTGMICHEFKGGIGTASRRLPAALGGWTVGVLVQANYGRRGLLRIDGVPVGEEVPVSEVPSPWTQQRPGLAAAERAPGAGSIVAIVATDAPLLPHQCARIARRAPLGVARTGGLGSTSSGDIFLAFATGNRGMPPTEQEPDGERVLAVRGLTDRALDPLFEATVEATEEAIVNALVAAETMTGRDGITAHRLPHDRLVEVMRRYGRLRG